MSLTKNTIVQANATIIAGLLILLTIQSITIPTSSEISFELKSYEYAIEYLEDMKANLTGLGDISQTDQGQQLDNELFKKYLDAAVPFGRAKAFQEFQDNPLVRQFSSLLAGILILPFSISAAIELLQAKIRPNMSEPNSISLVLMYIGFFLMGAYFFTANFLSNINL